ncbi:MAG: carboxypeptidase-like regulatory domain-containing protein, partial [Blastocatellia bacterium]
MKLLHRFTFPGASIALALCVALLCLALSSSALAQSGAAVLRGTVTDQQGKAIAGAAVKLTSEEKNFSRAQTTNEAGGYVFSALQPGNYRIEITANGFKKASINDVVAQVDTQRDVN